MPQVPGDVRRARAARLRAAGEAALQLYFAGQVGRDVRVLVERAQGAAVFGHSEHFAPVEIAASLEAGRVVRARISAFNAQHLLAEAA
jgi:threonylcarbamoyladenosine tRNA methylthiotransferase MtaB